jgi:hypothetical protein
LLKTSSDTCPEAPRIDTAGESPLGIILRLSAYTAILLGQVLVLRWVAKTYGTSGFSESSVFEYLQASIMAVTTAILIATAARIPTFRASCILLATCSALATVREFDAWLDDLLMPLGWQLPAFIVVSIGVAFTWPHRRGLIRQVSLFISSRSAALLWAGFIIAVFYAQIMGEKTFLRNVFGEDYSREGKRFIEESGEMCGYLLILFGSIEAHLQVCGTARRVATD